MTIKEQIPILSITGKKNSGKTTLIEGLLPEMNKRGWKVCTVKHHHFGDFELDTEGKDSFRHFQAGARGVMIASNVKFGYYERLESGPPPVPDLIRFFPPDTNLIVTEGYHKGRYPRIEVSRREISDKLISDETTPLIAVVSDYNVGVSVPVFPLDAHNRIVDFLSEFLKSGYEAIVNDGQ